MPGLGPSETTGYGDLRLVLRADRSSVGVGDTEFIHFSVKNVGPRLVVIETPQVPILDIVVYRVGDWEHPITTWSSQNASQVAHHLEWKPGETKALEMTWTARQEDFEHALFLTGIVSDGSGGVQGASVQICVGHPMCYSP